MTYQSREILIIGESKFKFEERPLDSYWNDTNPKPDLQAKGSFCHRAYIGTWKIEHDILYLINTDCKLENGSALKIKNEIPSIKNPLKAQWYTGRLTIPQSKDTSIAFENSESYIQFNREFVINIVDGEVKNKFFVENAKDLDIKVALRLFRINEKAYTPSPIQMYYSQSYEEFYFRNFGDSKLYFEKLIENSPNKYYSYFLNSYINILECYYGFDIPEVLVSDQIFKKLQKAKNEILRKLNSDEILSDNETSLRKLRIYELNEKVHWGKYVGYSINEIIEKGDVDYLLWCILNLEHFSMNDIIFLNPLAKESRHFNLAFKSNYIKKLLISELENVFEFWLEEFEDEIEESNDYEYDWSDVAGSYDPEDMATAYWNLD